MNESEEHVVYAKGKMITYSGSTPSNINIAQIEILGMENYFGNVIKPGCKVELKFIIIEPE